MTEERDLGPQPLEAILAGWGLSNHDLVEVSPEQLTHKQVQKAAKGRKLTLKMKQKLARSINFAVWGRLKDGEREKFTEYFPKHLGSYFLQILLRAPRRDRDALVTVSTEFCDRFRAAHLRLGLTRMEVAQKLGVKYHAVFYWESGEKQPTPKMAGEIAKLFGADVFSDSEEINSQLKIERMRRGWTSKNAADHFGIGKRHWSFLERGKQAISDDMMRIFSQTFDWKEGQYV